MMNEIGTSMLGRCLVGALCGAFASVCNGAWKPDQPVEIVVGTSPGSGSDLTARLIQRLLRERKLMDVPSSVLNRPGGGMTIAVNYLLTHPGNGHYFMVISPGLLTSHITGVSKINYTDTTPLAQIGRESVLFAVRAESPFKTGKELSDRFKADSASISVAFGSAVGNHNHIAIAQVVRSAGGDMKRLKAVVFNGSADAMTALLGGHVDALAAPAAAILPHVRAGRVRVLAVCSEQRLGGALAAVPTWKELGIAAVSANWRNAVGPKGLSEDQIRYWDDVFSRLVKTPEWKDEADAKEMENTYLNARDTRRFMDAQYGELTAIMREIGLAKQQ